MKTNETLSSVLSVKREARASSIVCSGDAVKHDINDMNPGDLLVLTCHWNHDTHLYHAFANGEGEVLTLTGKPMQSSNHFVVGTLYYNVRFYKEYVIKIICL